MDRELHRVQQCLWCAHYHWLKAVGAITDRVMPGRDYRKQVNKSINRLRGIHARQDHPEEPFWSTLHQFITYWYTTGIFHMQLYRELQAYLEGL